MPTPNRSGEKTPICQFALEKSRRLLWSKAPELMYWRTYQMNPNEPTQKKHSETTMDGTSPKHQTLKAFSADFWLILASAPSASLSAALHVYSPPPHMPSMSSSPGEGRCFQSFCSRPLPHTVLSFSNAFRWQVCDMPPSWYTSHLYCATEGRVHSKHSPFVVSTKTNPVLFGLGYQPYLWQPKRVHSVWMSQLPPLVRFLTQGLHSLASDYFIAPIRASIIRSRCHSSISTGSSSPIWRRIAGAPPT